MTPVELTTARLTLSAAVPADAAQFLTLLADLDVTRMTGTIPHPYTAADAQAFVQIGNPSGAARNETNWIIRRDGLAIGSIGLIDKDETLIFGYWLGKPFWGQGYGTEAAQAVVDWGRQAHPAKAMTACAFTDNPASRRILEKLGFVFTFDCTGTSKARGPGEWPTWNFRLEAAVPVT